jgi:undecaprenyl-diphosphatase
VAITVGAGVLATVAFAGVAGIVLWQGTTQFDHSLMLWFRALDNPATSLVMRAASISGSVPVVIVVMALVATWAFRQKAGRLGAVLLSVVLSADLLNVLLKMAFQRPRPDLFLEIVQPASFSFPSGHTMGSTAAYGLAVFVVAWLRPSLRAPLYVLTPVLVLLIGISRVFLGVHWPTDVLAGFAVGVLMVVIGKLALGSASGPPPVQENLAPYDAEGHDGTTCVAACCQAIPEPGRETHPQVLDRVH